MKKVTDVMLKFAVHTMILCVKSDSWSDFMKGGGGCISCMLCFSESCQVQILVLEYVILE